jgi:hypothetical protein
LVTPQRAATFAASFGFTSAIASTSQDTSFGLQGDESHDMT